MLHTERAGAVRFMHVKLLHHASIAIKTLIISALDNGTKYLHYMTYYDYRYALPLFFLCVHSNVGYIVVAVFIPENEDAGSISEVLELIRKENSLWNPRNMMVDFSLAEIAAIEECFPSKYANTHCPFMIEWSVAAKA